MNLQIRRLFVIPAFFFVMAFFLAPYARAQQTLGGITGVVTDASGAVVVNAMVTAVGDQTKLTRTQSTNANGIYMFVNLPIGPYTLTFSQAGFESQKHSFDRCPGEPHLDRERRVKSRQR